MGQVRKNVINSLVLKNEKYSHNHGNKRLHLSQYIEKAHHNVDKVEAKE
jgi:hypothetical protein